ncbi:hypothetical protein AFM16_37115 [Streptomyces antibioticus]|uniref:Uncharacterized protein n=1 Tax=Streptomyces antibioticus TaxID=1890 RepID=A0ABX3LCL4_STRAT|nr:hypothetical protein AFM16_37115 [Streptomyces antibioticus]
MLGWLAVTLSLLITVQVRRPLVHGSREWLFERIRRARREQALPDMSTYDRLPSRVPGRTVQPEKGHGV